MRFKRSYHNTIRLQLLTFWSFFLRKINEFMKGNPESLLIRSLRIFHYKKWINPDTSALTIILKLLFGGWCERGLTALLFNPFHSTLHKEWKKISLIWDTELFHNTIHQCRIWRFTSFVTRTEPPFCHPASSANTFLMIRGRI